MIPLQYVSIYILLISIEWTISRDMDVVVERPLLTYYNKKYLNYLNVSSVRDGRKGLRVTNLEGELNMPFGNNVTWNFDFHEFLHNEYRRTFVEVRKKTCALLSDDLYIGKTLAKKFNASCPLEPKAYHLLNMSFYFKNFHYTMPFTKGRVMVLVYQNQLNETIGRGHADVVFKIIESKQVKKN